MGNFRDYAAEMMVEIDKEINELPYISSVIANRVVDRLRSSDPELLMGWLEINAEQLIWRAINDRDRSQRAKTRTQAGGTRFKDAVEEAQRTGDDTKLAKFLTLRYVVDDDGTRKGLGDCTRKDLYFVADGYGRRAKESQMHQAFMKALAAKIGNDLVSDHFTDEQIGTIWNRMIGN